MWISEIELNNLRSFPDASIKLSKGINLIIGPNNSGKSTLLNSVLWLQQGFSLKNRDLRLSQENGFIKLKIHEANHNFLNIISDLKEKSFNFTLSRRNGFKIDLLNDSGNVLHGKTGDVSLSYDILNKEPYNFIYPYLSKRKVSSFNETINSDVATSVTGNLLHIYAKIDRICNTEMPAYKQYFQACQDILGFQITATHSVNGKQAAYIVSNHDNIPLDAMGEGIANLVGLIVDLCFAENQLFVIEEPENDVHPKALKKLLALIAEKAQNNQFVITTHSNIVTKYLGAQSHTKLFKVTMEFQNRLPTSQIEEIDNTPEARRSVLEELGYDFFDFDLWSAWLILEESSAERIIREYLIPWFVPDIEGRLRTFSARSVDEVEAKFEDFNKLFVYLHLQPVYKNFAWVVLDNGEKEAKIIERLKNMYTPNGWSENNFLQFSQHDFEKYYPKEFQAKVDTILEMVGGKHRQQSKKALLEEIITWIQNNPQEAKNAFWDSASDVIQVLQQIQSRLSINSSFRLKSDVESHS